MRFVIILICTFYCTSAWGSKIDSLLSVLEIIEISNKEDLYKIHSQLGKEFGSRSIEKYDMSGHHHALALKIAKEQNNDVRISKCQFGIGLSHQRRNNFQKALEHYYKIIELDDSNENLNKAETYAQIATIYQALGDFQKAFESQMKALFLYEVKNDQLGIAQSNYNVGTIFYYQKQFERSLDYYQKAKEIVDDLKNEKFNYSCVQYFYNVFK